MRRSKKGRCTFYIREGNNDRRSKAVVAPINTYTLLQSVVVFQPSTICSLSKGKPPVNFPTEEKCLFTTKALEKSCS